MAPRVSGSIGASAFVVLAAVLVAAAAGSSAQETVGTLFFTGELIDESGISPADQNVCGTKVYGMTSQPPTEATPQKAVTPPSYVGAGCFTDFNYIAGAPMALSGDASLHFFTSCDTVAAGFPALFSTYRAHLRVNGEEVSQATIFGGSGPCVDGSVEEHTLAVATDDTLVAEGDELSVRIYWWTFNPHGLAVDNAHFLVYGTDAPSGLTAAGLIAGPVAPTVVEEVLDPGASTQVELALEEPTTGTYVYRWETSLEGPVAITYDVALSNGSAEFQVADGTNATMASGAFNGTASDELVAEGAIPGNWTITLDLNETVGTLTISMAAHTVPEPEPQPTEVPTDNATIQNETEGNTTAAEDGGLLPGPAVPLIALGFVGAAIWNRRRRE